MKEKEIQSQIINWLESMGAYIEKVVLATRSGVPDLRACLNGRFIGIEVKQRGKVPTPLQEYKLRKVRDAGGVAFWCDSLESCKYEILKSGVL